MVYWVVTKCDALSNIFYISIRNQLHNTSWVWFGNDSIFIFRLSNSGTLAVVMINLSPNFQLPYSNFVHAFPYLKISWIRTPSLTNHNQYWVEGQSTTQHGFSKGEGVDKGLDNCAIICHCLPVILAIKPVDCFTVGWLALPWQNISSKMPPKCQVTASPVILLQHKIRRGTLRPPETRTKL